MRHFRNLRSGGIALIAAVSVLALLSVMLVALIATTSLEGSLGGNYVLQTRAQLAAESGLNYAAAMLTAWKQGPMPDALRQPVTRVLSTPTETAPAAAPGTLRNTVSIRDESGKLNLNDDNMPMPGGGNRLEAVIAALGNALFGAELPGAGAQLQVALFLNPETRRANYPDDQFPSMAAVVHALQSAGLTTAQIARFQDCVTLHSWRDPAVLRPSLDVHGGYSLYDKIGEPVDTNLEIQSVGLQTQARAPVNINTAPVELLQALLRTPRGVYLEEGPAENQSSQHYGFWSSGFGSDPTVKVMGRLRETPALTAERARRLALALYDRIHGTELREYPDDLLLEQRDADGDGSPGAIDPAAPAEPNPFTTWEEYRHFLKHGMPVETRVAIYLEDDTVERERYLPENYDAAHGYVDPHAALGPPPTPAVDSYVVNNWHLTPFSSPAWNTARAEDWIRAYDCQAVIDMLFANANPNALLNDFNPNANVFLMVDKAQLSAWSTEFCFLPTGVFGIESEGRVEKDAVAALAVCEVRAVLRLHVPLRIDSQADFLEGLQSPADLARFVAAAPASTPADRLPAAVGFDASPFGDHRLTLQSYPEPILATAAQDIARSDAWGYWMPATLEPDLRASQLPDPEYCLFLAHFNGATQDHDGNAIDPLMPNRSLNCTWLGVNYGYLNQYHQDAANLPRYGRVQAESANEKTGQLYPDGAYNEKGRTLAYPMGNIYNGKSSAPSGRFGGRGGLAFWIKPNFHTGVSTRIRKFFTGPSQPGRYARQSLLSLYYLSNPGWSSNVNFASYNSHYHSQFRDCWIPTRSLVFGWAWDCPNGLNAADTFARGARDCSIMTRDYPLYDPATPPVPGPPQHDMPGRQWSHLKLYWKFSNGNNTDLGMGVNNQGGVSSGNFYADFRVAGSPPGTPSSLYTVYPSTPLDYFIHLWLRFGEMPPDSPEGAAASPYYADATVDEIHGFYPGSTSPAFFAGRYLSLTSVDGGGVPVLAEYRSPEIRPRTALGLTESKHVALRSIAWTYYRAEHNRDAATAGAPVKDNLLGVPVNPNDERDPMIRYWAADASLPPADQPFARQWDPISVDFREAQGGLYFESRGDWDRRFTNPGGSALADAADAVYKPGESFQYVVKFHLQSGQLLYQAPVLDDVTITFALLQPEFLSYEIAR